MDFKKLAILQEERDGGHFYNLFEDDEVKVKELIVIQEKE